MDLTDLDADVILELAEIAEGDGAEKGHGNRVALLARSLAEGLSGVDPDDAFRAGLLHDVGKVWLPFRPDDTARALTAEERRAVREHSKVGADAARLAGERPAVVQAVLLHHERIDGSGYPYGLTGASLPCLAQVVAAADVWDALASARAYKPAWPRRLIERYLIRHGQRWFERRLLQALLDSAPWPD